jgi:DNA-binding PadR family transcriptional regulator
MDKLTSQLLVELLGAATAKEVALPSLSPKEAAILRQLTTSEKFGLQLVAEGGPGRGTVYVTLSRMQKRGLITSRQEIQSAHATGLPRRFYRITDDGRRILRAWEHAAHGLLRAGRLLRYWRANPLAVNGLAPPWPAQR